MPIGGPVREKIQSMVRGKKVKPTRKGEQKRQLLWEKWGLSIKKLNNGKEGGKGIFKKTCRSSRINLKRLVRESTYSPNLDHWGEKQVV